MHLLQYLELAQSVPIVAPPFDLQAWPQAEFVHLPREHTGHVLPQS